MLARVFLGSIGGVLVLATLSDMLNTLVATHTSRSKWWFTVRLYDVSWAVVTAFVRRTSSERRKNTLLATFAPLSILALLVGWILQQVIGWGLIWWAVRGLDGADGLGDSLYFSGVVYFTVGFGEIVPADAVPRIGALIEAFSGLLTTALVIGYLPSLFSAYAERERQLMSLDDGTEQRITPMNLILARSVPGDPSELDDFFAEWERWVAGVLTTHTSYPMLSLFRSQQPSQHWITALGLVTDAAVLAHGLLVDEYRSAIWLTRRSIRLFGVLTEGADLTPYLADFDERIGNLEQNPYLDQIYQQFTDVGFELHSFEEVFSKTTAVRRLYVPHMEFLIDVMFAPRGFWPHATGSPTFFPGQEVLGE